MSGRERLEEELKEFIVSTLALEDVRPEEIDTDDYLFGEGLGLDSVDALELAVALQKEYGVRIEGENEETRAHFTSIKTLADFIEKERQNSEESAKGGKRTANI